jgi:hypothetical protein
MLSGNLLIAQDTPAAVVEESQAAKAQTITPE